MIWDRKIYEKNRFDGISFDICADVVCTGCFCCKTGRGSENKIPVFGILKRNGKVCRMW